VAKLLNRNQRIETGVKNPTSVYSRVVSCMATPQGLAVIDYGYTIAVGQIVRLLSVRLFFLAAVPDTTNSVGFRVVTGTTEPRSAAEIYRWDSVLPLTWQGAGLDQWIHHHGRADYCWTMNHLFVGAGRRFGLWAQCNWVGLDQIYASFQISEG